MNCTEACWRTFENEWEWQPATRTRKVFVTALVLWSCWGLALQLWNETRKSAP